MLITISAFSLYGSISTLRRLGADMEPDSENAEIAIGNLKAISTVFLAIAVITLYLPESWITLFHYVPDHYSYVPDH